VQVLTIAAAAQSFAEEFMTFKNGDELRFGTETIIKVEVIIWMHHVVFLSKLN